MAEGIIYTGSAISVADGKGRFVLPLDMRKAVRASSRDETRLCLTLHASLPCAVAFGTAHAQWLQSDVLDLARIARERGEPFDMEGEMARRLADMEQLNFDEGGRFFLPEDIKEILGLGSATVFVGTGMHIQLWDPRALLESGTATPRVRYNVEKFLAGDGKARGK